MKCIFLPTASLKMSSALLNVIFNGVTSVMIVSILPCIHLVPCVLYYSLLICIYKYITSQAIFIHSYRKICNMYGIRLSFLLACLVCYFVTLVYSPTPAPPPTPVLHKCCCITATACLQVATTLRHTFVKIKAYVCYCSLCPRAETLLLQCTLIHKG